MLFVFKKLFTMFNLKVGALVLIIGLITFYALCYMASLSVAEIFNRVIATQHVFQGTLTVERLSANVLGRVTFHNLKWVSPTGIEIANIPTGYIWVRPFDVVTRSMSTMTIKGLQLDGAVLNLDFNKDMSLKNIDRTKREVKPVKVNGKRQPVSKEQWETSKIIGQKNFNFRVTLNDCVVNTVYEKRNFAMRKVDADISLDTRDKLRINFSSGEFAGTIEAKGLLINGEVDLKQKQPTCNLSLNIQECNPASLGTGIDIHEPVSTTATISGALPDVVIEGTMHMDRLTIPALDFTNVAGNYRYEDGLIKASKITANVYAGKVNAFGYFNLDTKGYEIDVRGKDLSAMIAARDPKIKCDVGLNLKIINTTGVPRDTITEGNFLSGPGSYMLVPFDSIRGEFRNVNKVLTFKNVIISTKFGEVTSNAFQIVRGKLHLGEIYLEDKESGTRQKIR